MNNLVKKAAVAKYSKLHAAGDSEESIKAAIAEDPKGYTPEQVEEIWKAVAVDVNAEEEVEEAAAPIISFDAPPKPNGLIKFDRYKAKPVYKYKIDEDTGEKERYLARVDKDGSKLSSHWMEQRHADNLNDQVENSGFYYFPAED